MPDGSRPPSAPEDVIRDAVRKLTEAQDDIVRGQQAARAIAPLWGYLSRRQRYSFVAQLDMHGDMAFCPIRRKGMTPREIRLENALLRWNEIRATLSNEFERGFAASVTAALKQGRKLSEKQEAQVLRIFDEWRLGKDDGEVME